MSEECRLAAIMFTDIVGYTSMMGTDEERAIKLLKSSHQRQKGLIEKYNGKCIKEIGDGLLAEFQSAINAVNCAIEIQKSSSADPIRIGIHLGDVFYDQNEVYGDGVNIASRIEGEAAPGGICISEHVYQNIKNKKNIQVSFLGRKMLKNVQEPVRLYQIKGSGIETKSKVYSNRIHISTAIFMAFMSAVISAFIFWYAGSSNQEKSGSARYYNIYLPEEKSIALIGSAPFGFGQTALTMSPDGNILVYAGRNGFTTQLYQKNLQSPEIRPLPGTQGAYYPFFSPDGRWVGFITGNTLKKISLTESNVFTICEVIDPFGAVWLNNHEIIFADNQGLVLKKVDANVGRIEEIIRNVDNELFTGHLSNPCLLPDGANLICNMGSLGHMVIINLNNNGVKPISDIKGFSPRYIRSGHLAFVHEDNLVITKFNLKELKTEGEIYPINKPVRTESINPSAQYTISGNGNLVYINGFSASLSSFFWLDCEGVEIEQLPLPPAVHHTFELSDDGARLAYKVYPDLWIYDIENGRNLRFINDIPVGGFAWKDGSDKIAFNNEMEDPVHIYLKSITGSGLPVKLEGSEGIFIYAMTGDGKYIATRRQYDFYLFDTVKKMLDSLVITPYMENQIQFSPDSRYFVYTSDETGQLEVYVQTLPVSGKKWNVSMGEGTDPLWSVDGDEIFFRKDDGIYAVKVEPGRQFNAHKPELIFKTNSLDVGGRSFAVSPDRNRFLVLKQVDYREFMDNVVIVENWIDEVIRKTSAN